MSFFAMVYLALSTPTGGVITGIPLRPGGSTKRTILFVDNSIKMIY